MMELVFSLFTVPAGLEPALRLNLKVMSSNMPRLSNLHSGRYFDRPVYQDSFGRLIAL